MASKNKRTTLEVGDVVLNGKYEILKVLHTTGMANIYIVQDRNLNKQWCMKEIIKAEAGRNDVEYYCLLNEARVLKGLNNPNIPRIVTIEDTGDTIFIVMDYIDGMSIKDWLTRNKDVYGRVPQDIAINWMTQICQVILYLHSRKEPILYRDMKPDNVMIQSNGTIKLLDFGTAVVIKEPGQKLKNALGTNGYAAPEQSKRGNVCDLRSDIYGMGKTLYYMLTGLNPATFPKGTKLKPIREIDSSLSIGVEKIVNKCCAEDPNNRYQSCEELLYALQNYKSLDTAYRKKIRRKVYSVSFLFLSSIFILITSLIPLNMYKAEQRQEYSNLMSVAYQSGKTSDYVNALDVRSDDVEPYIGLVESVKIDGVFSKEEEMILLNYLNPNLEKLKEDKDYGELAFEIGKLYWFYYEGEYVDEGMITSIKWFSDAISENYKKELADIYYNLGSFKKNIASSITESNDSGMYAKYWNNLLEASSKDTGEIVTLQLNLAISDCISTYSYNLLKDGVSYDSLINHIDVLNSFINNYTPSIDKSKDIYNNLKEVVPTLKERVDSVYKSKGGTR